MDKVEFPFLRALAALLVAAPSPLLAATPAGQADAGAIVLRPLSLLKKKDLDFGTLITSATAGTAVMDPATGTVTVTGGVTVASGASSPAIFVGAGSRNAPYQIRIPKNPVTLTRVGGTETMTASTWTLDGATNRRVGANQAFEFNVGATLAVGANQVAGTYVGTFDVTVHYP
jgi:spore coat protein U-like protein